MKKVLCILLAVIMCIAVTPIASLASETTNVSIDVSYHKAVWTEPADIKSGMFTYSFVYGDELLEYSKITVDCIDKNGETDTKVIDIRNLSEDTVNLSFDTNAAAEKIVIGFYCINKFNLINLTDVSLDIVSEFAVAVTDKEPRVFTSDDLDVIKEGFSAPFKLKSMGISMECTAEINYMQYTYNLNGEEGGEYENAENRYSFGNLNETIPLEIYQRAYGEERGKVLYSFYEKRAHGHCYGIAATSAALLANPEAIGQFKAADGSGTYAETLSDLTTEHTSDLFDASLKTYIKYGNIYQFDKAVQEARAATVNDLEGLYNAVKAYAEGNNNPVTISVYHTDGSKLTDGHEILATGLTETEDSYILLINDADIYNRTQEFVIAKDFSSWSYVVIGKGEYTSEDAQFSYTTPAEAIYNMGLSLAEGESSFFSNSTLIVATDAVAPKTLLEKLIELVFNSYGEGEEAAGYAYWLNEGDKEIELSSLADNNEITVADAETSIKVTIDNGDSARFVVDSSDESYVELKVADGSDAEIVFSTSADGEATELIINATADGEKITVAQTDKGLVVTGISEAEVTLAKNDEIIATEEISDADGEVIITYDKNTENGEAELDCHMHSYTASTVTPPTCTAEGFTTYTCRCGDSYTADTTPVAQHKDSDNDSKCDECGGKVDFCLCHKSGFFGILWEILSFIYKIFNINQYCICGQAHF